MLRPIWISPTSLGDDGACGVGWVKGRSQKLVHEREAVSCGASSILLLPIEIVQMAGWEDSVQTTARTSG